MPQKIYLPQAVIDSIRAHVEKAVKHAEAGYASSQEEEDSITGELGGALRTDAEQLVTVSEGNSPGVWTWSINYSKFGGRGGDSTESVVGADGILELKVGASEYQQKSALFQAKNTAKKDPRLLLQIGKMSVWREASFIIIYSSSGYRAHFIDDVLRARGSLSQAKNGVALAAWLGDVFLNCRVGHQDLYYDRNQRRLYWTKKRSSDAETRRDQEIWVDFSPKHLIHIDVSPPNWRWSMASEIPPEKIALSRLDYDPEDLFGVSDTFTLKELKRRRADLLSAYHPDVNNKFGSELSPYMNARAAEINNGFDELSARAIKSVRTEKPQNRRRTKPEGLREAAGTPVNDFVTKKRKPAKVRKK